MPGAAGSCRRSAGTRSSSRRTRRRKPGASVGAASGPGAEGSCAAPHGRRARAGRRRSFSLAQAPAGVVEEEVFQGGLRDVDVADLDSGAQRGVDDLRHERPTRSRRSIEVSHDGRARFPGEAARGSRDARWTRRTDAHEVTAENRALQLIGDPAAMKSSGRCRDARQASASHVCSASRMLSPIVLSFSNHHSIIASGGGPALARPETPAVVLIAGRGRDAGSCRRRNDTRP